MSRTLQESSDQLLEGSATREEHVLRSAAHAPREAPALSPTARTHPARLAAREVQALRPARLPLCQRSRSRPQALSPNDAFSKVTEYLDNYRNVREALNEICAINTE